MMQLVSSIIISIAVMVSCGDDWHDVNIIKEVPYGHNIVLPCPANDPGHLFRFWITSKDQIIGPGVYVDPEKFKYTAIDGTLHIRNFTYLNEGAFRCYVMRMEDERYTYQIVKLLVEKDPQVEPEYMAMALYGGAAGVATLLIGIAVMFLYSKFDERRRNLAEGIEMEGFSDTSFFDPLEEWDQSQAYENRVFSFHKENKNDKIVVEVDVHSKYPL